jgi:serine/threonine-protein kinase
MMDTEHWDRLESLLDQTLSLPSEQREAFLDAACGSDPALRAEVMELVHANASAESFFEELAEAMRPAASVPTASDPFHLIGRSLHHYEVLEWLGGGGMGVVYKAKDTRLRRTVALKFLPPHWSRESTAKQRFVYEAQAASALDHPNICTIFEINETERGQLFIAMAYYDGETLKHKIERGPMPVNDVIEITLQIAQGLTQAHARGIIHRDIKPDNVIVTTDGVVKIVDFGLAKLNAGDDITRSGATIGTVAYMSPEQVRSSDVDHRTDLWSLGILLYEMLTGERPFIGPYEAAIIYGILHEEPPAVTHHQPHVPPLLNHMVHRLLRKDPEQRYRDMAALVDDLLLLRDGSAALRTVELPPPRATSIAVLPFVNMSADPENAYFCEGLAEELINALTQLSGLHVAARTSSFAFQDHREDMQSIGRKLNVATVLEGSVRKVGNRLRITAQLINTADGYHLWSERYDRVLDDVFAIQDEITLAIVDKLKPKLLRDERAALVKRHTDDFDAYNLYLKGRFYWNKRNEAALRRSISYFEEAIAADPAYAKAYAGLAGSYMMIGFYGHQTGPEVYPKAEAAVKKALELDPHLAEAHVMLGATRSFQHHDWEGAERAILHALTLNPELAMAHYIYAGWVLSPTARMPEAIREEQAARQLDPLSLVINAVLAIIHWWAHRYDEALKYARETLDLNPDFWLALAALGLAHEQKGDFDDAIAAFEKAIAVTQRTPFLLSMLGHVHAHAGHTERARQILAEMEALRQDKYVSSFDTAMVHLGLGEHERALEHLERAYDERSAWLIYLNVDPRFAPLHAEPRLQAIRRKMRLPESVPSPIGAM